MRAANWELDHVLFATAEPAAAEALLAQAGLVFDDRRIHPGQGTANACAGFENAFFELLFVHDPRQLASSAVALLGLAERIRWRETGACPFGLCFRAAEVGGQGAATFLFETWAYHAAYLPPGMSIPIVTPQRALLEPLVFLLSKPRRAGPLAAGRRPRLTRVDVMRPAGLGALSPGVAWLMGNGGVSLREGAGWRLDLELDGGREGIVHEGSPETLVAVRR